MKHSLGQLIALGWLSTFAGCAFFSGKPPLPKHASINELAQESSAADFSRAVESADIVYFPQDRAASAGHTEPAALLLEAFERKGKPFVIGWGAIDATQQPILDELPSRQGEAREAAIARLELVGTGRTREHCRAILRDSHLSAVRYLALRCPPALLAKMGTANRLTPEEEQLFPRGFNSPAGGIQAYMARAIGKRDAMDGSGAGSYRVEMLRQQFAAEMIVRHFRAAGAEDKLLAFCNEADLEPGLGIPFYVAQKLQLRQLVFGRDDGRAQLLTRVSGQSRGSVKIVDGTPIAGRNSSRLTFPGTRARGVVGFFFATPE